jgi:hypothetical protein
MNDFAYGQACIFYKEDIDAIRDKYGVKLIFEQDGAATHKTKANITLLNRLFTKNGWIQNAPNSPDLAYPIEDLWTIIKPRVKRRNPTSIPELKKFLLEEWSSVPIELVQNLCKGFLNRIHKVLELKGSRLEPEHLKKKENDDLLRFVHMSVKGITNDISNDFQFNTVISKYRELTNAIYDWQGRKPSLDDEDKLILSFAIVSLMKLMSPVAVHLTEEAWHELGGEGSIHNQAWCKWDENLAKSSSITLVVQINGKVKDKIEVDEGLSQEEMKEVALKSEKVKVLTDGKTIIKTIVVPKKLVNIVVK